MKFHGNKQKKGTFIIQKSKIAVLVLNQSPISAVFTIVRFAGDPKTALTGNLLYYQIFVGIKELEDFYLFFQKCRWKFSGSNPD